MPMDIGTKVVLTDASLTSSLVPIGCEGTIVDIQNDMYVVEFININGEIMDQLVYYPMVVQDVVEELSQIEIEEQHILEKMLSKSKKQARYTYDDLEVI